QFDECGIVVVSADAEIPALLAAHAWEEAFWQRRARLLATTRFLLFGHGSWHQLRAPFFGLCAKAVYRVVEPGWLALAGPEALAETAAWLAAHFRAGFAALSPRSLSPLPLLGVPGVTADADCAGYYHDPRQFRPPRRARGA